MKNELGFYGTMLLLCLIGFVMNAVGNTQYKVTKIQASNGNVYETWGKTLQSQGKETAEEKKARKRNEVLHYIPCH